MATKCHQYVCDYAILYYLGKSSSENYICMIELCQIDSYTGMSMYRM